MSGTDRCRNAAAAATPPRVCARPAERSSCEATFSSGPAAAAARCHARRSGSASASVAAGQRQVNRSALLRCRRSIHRRTHQRMTERNTLAYRQKPARFNRDRRSDPQPVDRTREQDWISDRLGRGKQQQTTRVPQVVRRVDGCSSARSVPEAPRRPIAQSRPPTASTDKPRGRSSNASGLPRISAMIRSRTRSSNTVGTAEASTARASAVAQAAHIELRQLLKLLVGLARSEHDPTRSANRRRATNANVIAEARSSHCASSTTHKSGRSSATSDNRLSTAKLTRNRSGGHAGTEPENGLERLDAAETGSSREPLQHRRAQLMQAGVSQLRVGLHPHRPHNGQIGRRLNQILQQRGLPDSRPRPAGTKDRLSARRTSPINPSSSAHSPPRPSRCASPRRCRQNAVSTATPILKGHREGCATEILRGIRP